MNTRVASPSWAVRRSQTRFRKTLPDPRDERTGPSGWRLAQAARPRRRYQPATATPVASIVCAEPSGTTTGCWCCRSTNATYDGMVRTEARGVVEHGPLVTSERHERPVGRERGRYLLQTDLCATALCPELSARLRQRLLCELAFATRQLPSRPCIEPATSDPARAP